jgi:hypothetical protein
MGEILVQIPFDFNFESTYCLYAAFRVVAAENVIFVDLILFCNFK